MLCITNLNDLAERFKKERKALRLTQAEVARMAGLRRETIVELEAAGNVSAMTLLSAVSALGKGLEIVDRRVDVDRLGEIFGDAE